MQLWDIAGQDRFTSLTRAYARGAVGAIVVADISESSTFSKATAWKSALDDVSQDMPNGKKLPVVLMANKTDLLQVKEESAIFLFALCRILRFKAIHILSK